MNTTVNQQPKKWKRGKGIDTEICEMLACSECINIKAGTYWYVGNPFCPSSDIMLLPDGKFWFEGSNLDSSPIARMVRTREGYKSQTAHGQYHFIDADGKSIREHWLTHQQNHHQQQDENKL